MPQYITGQVDHVSPAYAYIVSQETQEDVWVKQEDLLGALDKDIVMVMLLQQAKGIVTLEVQTPNLVVSANAKEITEHQVFTIQKATTKKLIANDLYQYEFESGGPVRERTIKLYEKAAKEMYTLLYDGVYFQQVEENHPQKKQVFDVMIDNYNNIVVVYMRAKRYPQARQAIQTVLKYDKQNLKALVRLAKLATLDTTMTWKESNAALEQAEQALTYRDSKEEAEVRALRAKWNQKKKQAQDQVATTQKATTNKAESSS